MTLCLYDFLFRDMVSGVEGYGCIVRLEALPARLYFFFEVFGQLNALYTLINDDEQPPHA